MTSPSPPDRSQRQQAWRDPADAANEARPGRVVVLTRNPIAEAIGVIASTAGRDVVVVDEDDAGRGLAAVRSLGLADGDAVVVCDHDAPDAAVVLRHALASPASYVAMMASRGRAQSLLADLEAEAAPGREKLRVPAGLDLGGKAAGEIALSVVAEVVATAYGRPGGPMRSG